jgi:hypothetical protein
MDSSKQWQWQWQAVTVVAVSTLTVRTSDKSSSSISSSSNSSSDYGSQEAVGAVVPASSSSVYANTDLQHLRGSHNRQPYTEHTRHSSSSPAVDKHDTTHVADIRLVSC